MGDARTAWESFYVIVGSSGAALIGVQFVVITLIATMRRRATLESVNAFATPTVVYFASVLLLSAIVSAPWPSLHAASVALALCALGGLGYSAVVVRRARRQTHYKPGKADWLWYTILPCGLYAAVVVTALFLPTRTQGALFAIAGIALGLLFIGIRNAWDSVTYIAVAEPHVDEPE